ncbi:UNVERIFIED_CONTAM: hypothetical protein Sindi_2428700 [Sesamum indicum]
MDINSPKITATTTASRRRVWVPSNSSFSIAFYLFLFFLGLSAIFYNQNKLKKGCLLKCLIERLYSNRFDFAKSEAQRTIQLQEKLGKLKGELREAEDALVKALAVTEIDGSITKHTGGSNPEKELGKEVTNLEEARKKEEEAGKREDEARKREADLQELVRKLLQDVGYANHQFAGGSGQQE